MHALHFGAGVGALVFGCVVPLISCGGKSVVEETPGSHGGTGGVNPGKLGEPCENDFDCLNGAPTSTGRIARCSMAQRCELAEPEAIQPRGCYTDDPLPPLPLQGSRVYQSSLCESGICLNRHSGIDPSNTLCTHACVTDADCAEPYTFTPSCLETPIYGSADTDVLVSICMPTPPW